eukprot:scaffold434_cov186-Pinguiococcus_pyrenoidosus.AAC.78
MLRTSSSVEDGKRRMLRPEETPGGPVLAAGSAISCEDTEQQCCATSVAFRREKRRKCGAEGAQLLQSSSRTAGRTLAIALRFSSGVKPWNAGRHWRPRRDDENLMALLQRGQ